MLSLTQYSDIEHEFNKHVIKERQRYNIIYMLIEEYISQNSAHNKSLKYDNRIIMGGSSSVYLLMDIEKSRHDYIYDLYSESAFPHANKLVNLIAAYINKYMKNIFVSLQTVIQNTKYIIFVDNRQMIHLNSLRKMNNSISVFDLIKPVKKQVKNKTFYLLPPHFYLMEFYRLLYLPNFANQWANILEKENILYNNLKITLKESIGAKENNKQIILKHIFELFLLNNKDVALIDEAAIILNNDNNSLEHYNISKYIIIYGNRIKEFIESIKKSINILLKNDVNVNYKIQKIDVLSDHRLKRYIIKLEDKEILQIYNSGHYDIIPIIQIKIKNSFINIANPFVIMRFLLIEIYIINIVISMGKINEKYANHKLEHIINNVIKLRAKLKKMDVFQNNSDMYIGKFMDDFTYEKLKRKKLQQDKKLSFDYYPQKYFIDKSMYRDIPFL